jgi:hypothetical protein
LINYSRRTVTCYPNLPRRLSLVGIQCDQEFPRLNREHGNDNWGERDSGARVIPTVSARWAPQRRRRQPRQTTQQECTEQARSAELAAPEWSAGSMNYQPTWRPRPCGRAAQRTTDLPSCSVETYAANACIFWMAPRCRRRLLEDGGDGAPRSIGLRTKARLGVKREP